MEENKAPEILSAEAIHALAANADTIKSIFSSGDEMTALKKFAPTECCCPKLVKFKILLSNVWIKNINAVCPDQKKKFPL